MSALSLLNRLTKGYQDILGGRLLGFYVHGSVAFGCFTWETGDLDFIAVVTDPMTLPEKEAITRLLLELTPEAPPKGFEMSIVLARDCLPFVYPTPFELHFSAAHKTRAAADPASFSRDMHGTDPDLAAHFSVLRHTGLTLFGPPISEVFGEVPRSCYVDSILQDVSDSAGTICDAPVYCTLNLCRVLAFLQEGSILSKAQGGAWGLAHLPEIYHSLLRHALSAYQSGTAFTQTDLLGEFAADLLQRIHILTEA